LFVKALSFDRDQVLTARNQEKLPFELNLIYQGFTQVGLCSVVLELFLNYELVCLSLTFLPYSIM